MRVRHAQRCTPKYGDIMCAERAQAQRDGEFRYSVQARGWVLCHDHKPVGPPPYFTLTWCPYCLEPLPSVESTLGGFFQYWKREGEGEE